MEKKYLTRGATLVTISLLRENVFVTTKAHPPSKALLIIGQVVAGGAEAKPNGLRNLRPQNSTLKST